jgi:uncharacterized membrane protein HdeD (DUF308 family)
MKTNEMIILKYLIVFIFFILGIIPILVFNRKKDEDGNQDISASSLKILFGGLLAIASAIGLLYRIIKGIP